MSLPFTHEQFLDVFAAYNTQLWPAILILWLTTAGAVGLLAVGRANARWLAGLLAIHWLWSGAVYHLGYFASINPAAKLFGLGFILQALLITWLGVVRRRLDFVWRHGTGVRGILAVFFALYALAYPVLALSTGLDWPRSPTFGVPCPTTLLTVGLLLSVKPVRVRGLSVIPLTWTIVGGSAAILLGVLPDAVLLFAGAVLLLHLFTPGLLTGPRRDALLTGRD